MDLKKIEPKEEETAAGSESQRTPDDIKLLLDIASKTLGELSLQSAQAYDELRLRLGSSVSHIVAETLGMLLIGSSFAGVFINAFTQSNIFPGEMQMAALIIGAIIFLAGAVLHGVTNILALRDVSQRSDDLSRKADAIRQEFAILRG
jgi:hypothetical protein